jgi:hypothetical protein
VKILLGDSREMFANDDPTQRILIFGPPSASQFVHLIQHIHVDGTFSIRPKLTRKRPRPVTVQRRRRLTAVSTLEEALEGDEEEEQEEEREEEETEEERALRKASIAQVSVSGWIRLHLFQ